MSWRLILSRLRTRRRGSYPEDMALRVNVFYGAGLISTDEYDELMGMLV